MHVDRDLDAILDQALASYTHAEPDPGLRARIVARAEETPARPWRSIVWPAAIALSAAALLVGFMLHPTSPLPKPESPAAPIASAPPPAIVTPRSTTSVHRDNAKFTRHRNFGTVPSIGRRRTFPSPTPLTAEEKALLRLATEHPQQARQALAPAPEVIESAPLTVEPIRIAALSEPQSPQSFQ